MCSAYVKPWQAPLLCRHICLSCQGQVRHARPILLYSTACSSTPCRCHEALQYKYRCTAAHVYCNTFSPCELQPMCTAAHAGIAQLGPYLASPRSSQAHSSQGFAGADKAASTCEPTAQECSVQKCQTPLCCQMNCTSCVMYVQRRVCSGQLNTFQASINSTPQTAVQQQS